MGWPDRNELSISRPEDERMGEEEEKKGEMPTRTSLPVCRLDQCLLSDPASCVC